jgi:hypothetical protein
MIAAVHSARGLNRKKTVQKKYVLKIQKESKQDWKCIQSLPARIQDFYLHTNPTGQMVSRTMVGQDWDRTAVLWLPGKNYWHGVQNYVVSNRRKPIPSFGLLDCYSTHGAVCCCPKKCKFIRSALSLGVHTSRPNIRPEGLDTGNKGKMRLRQK